MPCIFNGHQPPWLNQPYIGAYGKPVPEATFHYEFHQNAHTLDALESLIFNGIACCLWRLSDLCLAETIS